MYFVMSVSKEMTRSRFGFKRKQALDFSLAVSHCGVV